MNIPEEEDEIKEKEGLNMIDYLYVLVKRRRLIIINFLSMSILAAAYSLIIPKTYTSTAVIMPPGKSGGIISNLPLNLPISGIGSLLGVTSEEANIFLAILKSRTIAKNTIDHFDLYKRYGSKTIDDAIHTFYNKVDISLDKEGTIRVKISATTKFFHKDKDEESTRKLSADIANYMISELDRINTELQTKQAKYNRIFIEKRYEESKIELNNIEEKIKDFEEKYGVISLPDQVSAAIEAAAQIESQILMIEVELEGLKSTFNMDHPMIKQKEIQLRELRKKLNEMKLGSGEKNYLEIFPAFIDAPNLGIQYIRLKRELEVQNLIYQFLTQQYEQAKIQEAKDTPTVQVLDLAVPPIKRSKPKRKLLVLLVGLISLIFSALYIFTIGYFNRLKKENVSKYKKIIYIFRSINIFKKFPAENSSFK